MEATERANHQHQRAHHAQPIRDNPPIAPELPLNLKVVVKHRVNYRPAKHELAERRKVQTATINVPLLRLGGVFLWH